MGRERCETETDRYEFGVGVPEGVDGDAGGEVEVFPVLGVPNMHTLSPSKDERRAGVDGQKTTLRAVEFGLDMFGDALGRFWVCDGGVRC